MGMIIEKTDHVHSFQIYIGLDTMLTIEGELSDLS